MKKLFSFLCLLVVVLLFVTDAFAVTWTQNFQDNFTRANSSTVGNNWTAATVGVWSINSNNLLGTSSNGSGYLTDFLERPSGENVQDQRAVLTAVTLGSTTQGSPAVILRHQSGNSNYLCNASPTLGGEVNIYYISGAGTVTNLETGTPTLNTTDSYTIDCSAVGTNPTTLNLTVTDVTTSTVVYNQNVTDSTADVQNATGAPGLLFWSANGTAVTFRGSLFTSYHNVAPSIVLSPTTYTGNGSVTIAVTGTATAFTGTPFTVSGTPSASITSQSVSSGTAGSVTVAVGSYVGILTITDSISGAVATIQIYPPLNANVLNVCYLGDSITSGTNGNPVGSMGGVLQNWAYNVTQTNVAISGTSTGDWVNSTGGANLTTAIATCVAAGATSVQVMLGTNDARTPNSFTPATHEGYMATIVAALKAAGFKVVINQPLWTVPNTTITGVTWPNNTNVLYQQYYAADLVLVDNVHVFAGDTLALGWFENNPTHLADGVHPTSGGNVELGNIWAYSFLKSLHLLGGGTFGYIY